MNGPPEKGKAAGMPETPTTADTGEESTDIVGDAADERKRLQELRRALPSQRKGG
jgi:hypothetical protein